MPGAAHGVPASPAGQVWQAALPLPAFFPMPQSTHVKARGIGANVFSGHTIHAIWPVRLLAVPGIHGKHDAELLYG